MASFNNGNYTGSPSFDNLLIQNLIGKLHLRPPYLGSNSFLSQSLDEFLFQDGSLSEDDVEEPPHGGGGGRERSLLAREETKLEKEIIRIVRSGSAEEALKPNSGQSVAIGDHNICVGYHEEPGSEYRIWEWHGHIMLFDDENGYSPEYIYGNYFERVPPSRGAKERGGAGSSGEDEGKKEKGSGNSGLRDLIGEEKDAVVNGGGRVLHRNSLGAGLAKK